MLIIVCSSAIKIIFYGFPSLLTIDKVYIDGPRDLLIRRSIEKLLAEPLFVIRKYPGPIVQ